MPGLWTMQGFGRPHYTNVVMPFPDLPPNVPEQNETGHLPAGVHDPARLALAPGRPPLRRRRGRALRAGERRAGRDREGLPHAGGVRHQRPRSPRRRRTSSSPSSSAGRTRASSRTRTSGGTLGCRARSVSSRRPVRDVEVRAGIDGQFTRARRARVEARLLDARGRAVAKGDAARTGGSTARCARRDCGRRRSLRSTRSSSSAGRRDRHRPRRLPRRRDSRPPAARQRRARADRRRQPARPRRHAWPRGHSGADGAGRAADEAVQRQRRAHVALPERPVLARALRPVRPLRRRRGERRVARVLRRALPRPALPQPVGRARREHGRARQEPSERDLLVARQRERLRPEPRRRGGLGTRSRPFATAPLRGRDHAGLERRPSRHRRRLPDVRRRRLDRGVGGDEDRRPAAADPLRVLARDGQLERRARRLLRRVQAARRAPGRVHLGVGRPRHPAARRARARVLGVRRRLRRHASRRELLRGRDRLAGPHAASGAARAQVPRAADPRRVTRRRALPDPQPPPLRAARPLPRRVGADRRRRAAQGRPPAGAARGARRVARHPLELPPRRRRALRHLPLLPPAGAGLGAGRARGRAAAARRCRDERRSELAAAPSGRARTAFSRPTACARWSISPRASCASSRSTGATSSSTDHGYSSGGPRPTTTACRRCRADRAASSRAGSSSASTGCSSRVVSARADGSAVELVHRADGLVTHRQRYRLRDNGELLVENVVELVAAAPRRAANRGRAHPPARPRSAHLVRPRPVGGVLGPARVHRRRPLREHGRRPVRALHPPAGARPPSGYSVADADRRRRASASRSAGCRRSDSGRATSPPRT